MCARCNCRLLAVPPYLPLVCSNVLLDGSLGTAKICDLGKSGILQASIVTAHGTPNRYSSPEQLAGGWCGPASDIYSLGIVMLEVLTGRAARGRDARAELQLRCAVLCAGLTVCPICLGAACKRCLLCLTAISSCTTSVCAGFPSTAPWLWLSWHMPAWTGIPLHGPAQSMWWRCCRTTAKGQLLALG